MHIKYENEGRKHEKERLRCVLNFSIVFKSEV